MPSGSTYTVLHQLVEYICQEGKGKVTLASTASGCLGRGGEKASSLNEPVGLSLVSRAFGACVLPHFLSALVLSQSSGLAATWTSRSSAGSRLPGQLLSRHHPDVVMLCRFLKHFFLVLSFQAASGPRPHGTCIFLPQLLICSESPPGKDPSS